MIIKLPNTTKLNVLVTFTNGDERYATDQTTDRKVINSAVRRARRSNAVSKVQVIDDAGKVHHTFSN